MNSQMRPPQAEYDVVFAKAIFVRLTNSEFIDGSKASIFLKTSSLPLPILHAIWDIADSKSEGQLDINGFVVACRLVAHSQIYNINNPGSLLSLVSTPPSSLPKFDLSSFAHEFDPLFASLDVDSDGFITGKDARVFYLSNTKYDSQTLIHLWDLSDVDCDGLLSKHEFYTMQLLLGFPGEKNEFKQYGSQQQSFQRGQLPLQSGLNMEDNQVPFEKLNFTPAIEEQGKNEILALTPTPQKPPTITTKGILNDANSAFPDDNILNHSPLVITPNSAADELVERERRKLELIRAENRNLLQSLPQSPNRKPNSELELLRSQVDDLDSDIADLKLKNKSLLASVNCSESNVAAIHANRKNLTATLEKEEELLKAEQRELEQLKIILQAMKRNKQLLQREGNSLNERLQQNESSAKMMQRALENEQSKVLNVKNERLLISKDKLEVKQEIKTLSNQTLLNVFSKEKNNSSHAAAPGSERDSKGIRVVNCVENTFNK